ncbi:MAG: MarR family winged helix-turn-helix transcriptional regulator [Anaerolineales bacterium]
MSLSLLDTLHEWLRVVMRFSMRNLMLYAKEHNYSMAQLNALFRIYHRGSCGISELGEEMGVTSAAVSQLLDRLVQQGLAVRAEDLRDRRNKVVQLTEAGRSIVQDGMAARQMWLAKLVDSLTPQEQQQVEAAIRLLLEKARFLEE